MSIAREEGLKTVRGRDAEPKPPWTGSRRVFKSYSGTRRSLAPN